MKRNKPKKKPTIEQFMRAQIMKIKAVVPGMNVTQVVASQQGIRADALDAAPSTASPIRPTDPAGGCAAMTTIAQQLEQLEQDMRDATTPANGDPLVLPVLGASVRIWADRISAIRAAVGGEAVAWTTQSSMEMLRDPECGVGMMHCRRTDYINVPLYASPPATVDVGAFKGLMRDLMQRAKATRTYDTAEARTEARTLEGVIDKLAALIGEKA